MRQSNHSNHNTARAAYIIKGVCKAGHELGLHEFRLACLELGILLHGERGGLQAELAKFVVSRWNVLGVGGSPGNDGAGVGNASALYLQVCKALELVVREGIGRLRRQAE